MARSEITGKRKLLAQNVSHSNIKTKRWQNMNIQTRRVWVPELNRFVTLSLTTRDIRTIDKIGVTAYAKRHGVTSCSPHDGARSRARPLRAARRPPSPPPEEGGEAGDDAHSPPPSSSHRLSRGRPARAGRRRHPRHLRQCLVLVEPGLLGRGRAGGRLRERAAAHARHDGGDVVGAAGLEGAGQSAPRRRRPGEGSLASTARRASCGRRAVEAVGADEDHVSPRRRGPG